MHIWGTKTYRSIKLLPIVTNVALLMLGVAPSVFAAGPTQLPNRYDKLSSSGVSSTASHNIGFNISNLSVPVGSITIQYCANSPLIEDPCTPPTGLNAISANLNSSSGEPGFSIGPGSTANKIVLTRPASLPTGSYVQFFFSNITNPSNTGTFFGRLQTFTSTDGSGLPIQYGGVVMAIVSPLSVTTEVPPYLTFCVGVIIVGTDCSSINSYFIDVGELSSSSVRAASSEFAVATNAPLGYSISISGSTLTSGSNTIPAIALAASSVPGTGQFGVNLRSNASPNIGSEPIGYPSGTITASYAIPNMFRFQSGDTLVTATNTSDYEKFTVSYITNVSTIQAAGIYATTLTYIALANF